MRVVAGDTTLAVPMAAEQQAAFDHDGYLIVRGALSPDETAGAAVEVTAGPGDARRCSFACTYRWTAIRDDLALRLPHPGESAAEALTGAGCLDPVVAQAAA